MHHICIMHFVVTLKALVSFPGTAEFLKNQRTRKLEHARQFTDYQITRGGKVRISAIDEPEISFKTSDSALYQGIKAAIT